MAEIPTDLRLWSGWFILNSLTAAANPDVPGNPSFRHNSQANFPDIEQSPAPNIDNFQCTQTGLDEYCRF